MDEKQLYINAAKIISSCPKERLPYVLKTLEDGGISFDSEEIKEMCRAVSWRDRTVSLTASRSVADTSNWSETTNPCILKLREAYKVGISLTKLSRMVGLNRSTLYKYLYASIIPNRGISVRIMEAINELTPN